MQKSFSPPELLLSALFFQAILITGHKTAASLNNYRVLSNRQQMSISHALGTAGPQESSTAACSQVVNNVTCQPTQQQDNFQSAGSLSLFKNAVISGGVFNITVNVQKRQDNITPGDEELLQIDM